MLQPFRWLRGRLFGEWRVGLKWGTGLLGVAALSAAFALFALFRLTSEEPATATVVAVVGGFYVQAFEDEFAQFQEQARQHPEDELVAPGLTFGVRGADFADLGQKEAIRSLLDRVAETLYYEGTDAAQSLVDLSQGGGPGIAPPASLPKGGADDEIEGPDLSAMGLLTEGSHDKVGTLWRVPAILGALLLLASAGFSRGFGRLGTPGVCLLVAAFPAALAAGIAGRKLGSTTVNDSGFTAELLAALQRTVSDLGDTYQLLIVAAALLAVLAVAGTVGTHVGPRVFRLFRSRPGRPA